MRSRLTLWALLGLSCATPAAAQLASQTALVGTVTDSGGGVVPGAQVIAVNAGTKDTYEATTNAEGYYHIQFVRPAPTTSRSRYRLPDRQGERRRGREQPGRPDQRRPAGGGVTETVNVEADAQVLNTDSAAVSETIGERAIVELPLSGRNVWNLASTTPGVLGGLTSDIGLSFRGAGQREIQNSLSLDGINASSNLLAATSMRPIADAVTEMQVQTGSTSAEYGSYLGVHINVVTKSGTNSPTVRCSTSVRAKRSTRAAISRTARTRRIRATATSSASRWTVRSCIPKLYNGRNKTFFMAAYEGVRGEAHHQPFATVPTAKMRQGNFSEMTTRSGTRSRTSRSPATSFPPRCCRRPRCSLLQVLSDGEPAGPAPPTCRPSANT